MMLEAKESRAPRAGEASSLEESGIRRVDLADTTRPVAAKQLVDRFLGARGVRCQHLVALSNQRLAEEVQARPHVKVIELSDKFRDAVAPRGSIKLRPDAAASVQEIRKDLGADVVEFELCRHQAVDEAGTTITVERNVELCTTLLEVEPLVAAFCKATLAAHASAPRRRKAANPGPLGSRRVVSVLAGAFPSFDFTAPNDDSVSVDVWLVGMQDAGKTTVRRLLARLLQLRAPSVAGDQASPSVKACMEKEAASRAELLRDTLGVKQEAEPTNRIIPLVSEVSAYDLLKHLPPEQWLAYMLRTNPLLAVSLVAAALFFAVAAWVLAGISGELVAAAGAIALVGAACFIGKAVTGLKETRVCLTIFDVMGEAVYPGKKAQPGASVEIVPLILNVHENRLASSSPRHGTVVVDVLSWGQLLDADHTF